MPKVIKSDVREVLLKVKEYFLKEKQATAPIIPFVKWHSRRCYRNKNNCHVRSSYLFSGISLRTMTRIIGEGRLAEASSSKIVTPGKNRKKRKDKILMDDFDISVLRRKIHEFYTKIKEIPTVNKLYCALKKDIGFKVLKDNDETHKLPVVYLDETYIHSGLTFGKCWQNDDGTVRQSGPLAINNS
ncbi:unnamed protein product [Leptidea sinapis]|uniref:Uncharacterized protein n=1 Tax=Leptidea sinapis TaxID=189913 RepID=A0A5E4PPL1_9NEOP|nr:unnamed protein product [Leptidea sinapis]